MEKDTVPEWILNLEEEDLAFIRKLVLASGSLKQVAKQYGVTYPTVRLRLNRLIKKIQMSEEVEKDPYIGLIRRLSMNDKLDFNTATTLIGEYRRLRGV